MPITDPTRTHNYTLADNGICKFQQTIPSLALSAYAKIEQNKTDFQLFKHNNSINADVSKGSTVDLDQQVVTSTLIDNLPQNASCSHLSHQLFEPVPV
jgi:hypothetical protein